MVSTVLPVLFVVQKHFLTVYMNYRPPSKVSPQAIRSACFCSFWLVLEMEEVDGECDEALPPSSSSTFSYPVLCLSGQSPAVRVGEVHQIRLLCI